MLSARQSVLFNGTLSKLLIKSFSEPCQSSCGVCYAIPFRHPQNCQKPHRSSRWTPSRRHKQLLLLTLVLTFIEISQKTAKKEKFRWTQMRRRRRKENKRIWRSWPMRRMFSAMFELVLSTLNWGRRFETHFLNFYEFLLLHLLMTNNFVHELWGKVNNTHIEHVWAKNVGRMEVAGSNCDSNYY